MLMQMWNTYRLSPTVIYVNAQEQKNITNKCLTNASGPLVRYNVDASQSAPYEFTASGVVRWYYNPFTGVEIPLVVHPDLLMTVEVTNAGPEADVLHVLPTAWFRNTWSWEVDSGRPSLEATGAGVVDVRHPFLGDLELLAGPDADGTAVPALFCDNETNTARLYGAPSPTPFPKDGINDHVVSGAASVNPDQVGTKCAFWYRLSVPAGETVEVRVRLRPSGSTLRPAAAFGADSILASLPKTITPALSTFCICLAVTFT